MALSSDYQGVSLWILVKQCLVTLFLWPGPPQRRDGARQARAGVRLVPGAGQDEERGSGASGDGSPWGHAHVHIRVQAVWGVNRAEEVFVRMGLTPDEPRGKEWTKIEGNMKTIR